MMIVVFLGIARFLAFEELRMSCRMFGQLAKASSPAMIQATFSSVSSGSVGLSVQPSIVPKNRASRILTDITSRYTNNTKVTPLVEVKILEK